MRSMVEGILSDSKNPSTTAYGGGPPPRQMSGRI